MEQERIILSAMWIALMLTYLLGDVLRIFAGDFKAGEMSGGKATQAMWMGAALLMLIPIFMLVLSLVVPYDVIRWLTIIAAAGLFLLNVVSVMGYPGLYDRFLIVVGLVFNVVTIVYAWNWSPPPVAL
ncbi:MAG: hypothetical protein IPM16_14885 [Chloroflexi bacterium]|nr:hypothetical protein [Chloroflexota bacterium]